MEYFYHWLFTISHWSQSLSLVLFPIFKKNASAHCLPFWSDIIPFFFFFTKSRWESSQLILTSSSPQLHRKCLGHHPTNDPLRFTICPMQGLFLSFSNSLSCPLQFCPMLAKCHLLYFGSYNYTLLVLFISHCSCVSFKGLYFLLLFHSL